MRSGPPAIEADGLTKRFDAFVAVDHVSFRIEKGEIFGFLGSNGCGKSTTMKMLTGLLPPTEGKAMLFGRPVSGGRHGDASARRLHVAGLLALWRALGPAEPRAPRQAVRPPRRRARQARRRDARSVRAPGGGRRRAGKPAARHPPAPAIGGRDPASARDADPGRADIGRRSGRPRPVLGIPDRSLPQRRGDDLPLHALHERGDALRPHLAHALRQGARRGRAAGAGRSPSRQVARGGVHRLSRGRGRRRPQGRQTGRTGARAGGEGLCAAEAERRRLQHFRGSGPTRVGRRWRSCAIRCGSPSRILNPDHPDVRDRLRHLVRRRASALGGLRSGPVAREPAVPGQLPEPEIFRPEARPRDRRSDRVRPAQRRAEIRRRGPDELRPRPDHPTDAGDRRLDQRRHAVPGRDDAQLSRRRDAKLSRRPVRAPHRQTLVVLADQYRGALPLQPVVQEHLFRGAQHHHGDADPHPRDHDGARRRARGGERLDRQLPLDPGDAPRIPARQAASLRPRSAS